MSAPPADITAILAALGQKPGGNPSAGGQQPAHSLPQPPVQQQYPGNIPAATPPNPIPGMPLPQPTSSGSLDLSAIKPVNSGSVSLQEAIAKVREKAQSRDENRTTSRNYRRSRSRSRSPARRDNYRNDYNPYRDERRDDRGRAAGGRDRSFSPQRRGYSPPPNRFRSPPTRNEDGSGSEVITVSSSDVGLIIGRGGENLRRVESETGARVQFLSGPENSGPQRQCRISGTLRQRTDAKNDIFRVTQESPSAAGGGGGGGGGGGRSAPSRGPPAPPVNTGGVTDQGIADDGSLQIMVPDKTVGLIIGRGGETIRDLQDRSGCHVNITSENQSINGLRPVNLIGSHESQLRAKELIMEVVQSDTRGDGGAAAGSRPDSHQQFDAYPGGGGNYGGSVGGGGGGGGGGDGNQKINDKIQVPSDAVGMIIGKGGETIKEMQNQSGCKINVSQPSGADYYREIGLIGTYAALEHAKRLIDEKVNAVREKQGGRLRADAQPNPQYQGSDYSRQQQQQQQQQYAAAYGQQPAAAQAAQPATGAAAGGDPYAPYGGYQNYVAMWYAGMQAQQQQQQQGGASGAPPS